MSTTTETLPVPSPPATTASSIRPATVALICPRVMLLMRTSGVPPMVSRMVSQIFFTRVV